MKTRLILILAIIIVFISSCKKTTTVKTVTDTTVDTVSAIETPVKTIIAQQILVDTLYPENDGTQWEQGNTFYSSVNGTISELGAIFPDNGTYVVSLWNATADTLITSANVTCTDSTKFSYTNITPVHIIANTQYLLANNTGSAENYYFIGLKPLNTYLAYPYSVGNITFTGYYYIGSTGGNYPTSSLNSYLINSDFVFKAD